MPSIDKVRFFELISTPQLSQFIYAAAKFEIADYLAISKRPMPVEDIAFFAALNKDATLRMLRILASYGIFEQTSDGRFQLTPLADPLRTESPDSLRYFTIMLGEPWMRQAWSEISYTLETGKPAFNYVHGMGTFEYFKAHPRAGEIFNKAMGELTRLEMPALKEVFGSLTLSGNERVIDIGGGQGTLLKAFLEEYPSLTCELFEKPEVLEGIRDQVDERIAFGPGDFFGNFIPFTGDIYILQRILHDWGNDQARRILRNIRSAMRSDAQLFIFEIVISTNPAEWVLHPEKQLMDGVMMVVEGGADRTEEEFRKLLNSTGFGIVKLIHTHSPTSIIVAKPQ